MVNPQAMCSLWPSATPGKPGFAGADDVPSRSDQMHHVAQRRQADHAVRIVGEQRLAAGGECAGDGPVVAAFEGMRGELDALVAADEILQQIGRESGQDRVGSGIERDRGIEVEHLRSLLRAEFGEGLGVFEFAEGVAGHGERGHAIQAILRMPGVGRKSGELKFDGQPGAAGSRQAGDIGVDAVGKGVEDRSAYRARSFHIPPSCRRDSASARALMSRGRAEGPEDFGQPSLAGTLPDFHLKEAILGGDHALGKEKIVLVLGVNVRDSPAIAQNVDGLLAGLSYPTHRKPYRQSSCGGSSEICLAAGLGLQYAEWNQENQQAEAFHRRPIVMPSLVRRSVTGRGCLPLQWQNPALKHWPIN